MSVPLRHAVMATKQRIVQTECKFFFNSTSSPVASTVVGDSVSSVTYVKPGGGGPDCYWLITFDSPMGTLVSAFFIPCLATAADAHPQIEAYDKSAKTLKIRLSLADASTEVAPAANSGNYALVSCVFDQND